MKNKVRFSIIGLMIVSVFLTSCGKNQKVETAYMSCLRNDKSEIISMLANEAYEEIDDLNQEDLCKLTLVYMNLIKKRYFKDHVCHKFCDVYDKSISNGITKAQKVYKNLANHQYSGETIVKFLKKEYDSIKSIEYAFVQYDFKSLGDGIIDYDNIVEEVKETLTLYPIATKCFDLNVEIGSALEILNGRVNTALDELHNYGRRYIYNKTDLDDEVFEFYSVESSLTNLKNDIGDHLDNLDYLKKCLIDCVDDTYNLFCLLSDYYYEVNDIKDLTNELDDLCMSQFFH